MRATDVTETGEDGIALFYSLLVTIVVSGIVVVVFATAFSEQRQAAFELDFEDTVHVAETGAETFLARLAEDNADDSGIPGPEALGVEPATWAIEAATRKSDGVTFDFDVIQTAEGEAVPLRPVGVDAEFIYGVGFTPSREAYVNGDGEPYARVVRVQVAFSPATFSGDKALLVGGNLTLSGNYKIYGSSGSVHTNGGIDISGSTGTTDGGVSYSGSCSSGCDQATGPVASEPIQQMQIREFWGSDEALEIAAAGDWYDYCSGTWYRRTIGDDEPCDGTVLIADPQLAPWSGLSYSGNGLTPNDAVYYFAGDHDIAIKQPSGDITFMTEGDVKIGPSAGATPPEARYPGVYILAEGDVSVDGNAAGGDFETDNPAVVWANGTIDIDGTMETNQIAFIAYDGASVGSSYQGGGSGSITYNGGAVVNLPGEKVPLVVQWDEVR